MRLTLEPNSGVPLGFQIVQQIKLAVASGRMPMGQQLPSARDLATQLKVNFHTVLKAYGDLEAQGILRLDRGKGTFVRDRPKVSKVHEAQAVVHEHVQRLLEDLAGFGLSEGQIEVLMNKEFHQLFRSRKETL